MESQNSSIDLDHSSVLSSTKNDDVEDISDDEAISDGSSDTEGPEESAEISNDNYVTSLQTPGKPSGLVDAEEDGREDRSLELSADEKSVSRASQLLTSDSSLTFSRDNTIRETTVSELSRELADHSRKLQEEVVEGFGEKEEKQIRENGMEVNQLQEKKVERSNQDEVVSKRPFDELLESQISPGELSDVEDNEIGVEDALQHLHNISGAGYPRVEGMVNKKARISSPDLPDTVQVLVSSVSGAKIYLIGTAHFSKESCEDVSRIIQATQPDIVMVELCKQRTNILHLDEETILEEAQNLSLERSLEVLRQQGTLQGVMYLLLLSMSAHITKELGMAPGGEFRTAYKEAQKVPRCMVHLGDRPIGITLQRALGGLTVWQKIRLGFNILTSKDTITKEEVEKCKQRDLLENMLAEMAGEFPALSRVFVSERDLFLAHSLQMSADSLPSYSAGSGVPSPRVVVGVVGIGHVPGIVANWGKVTKEQIRDIVRVDPPTRTERVVKFAVRFMLIGSCCYGAYRLGRIPVSRFLLAR